MAVLVNDQVLPTTFTTQGNNAETRGNRYGEPFTELVTEDIYAEEGSLFATRSATLGTGIAQTANTTEDTTKPFITFYNPTATVGALGKSVRLLRIKMRPTAVSSGQTIQNFSMVTGTGNFYSSAGTDYSAAVTGINATVGIANIGKSGSNVASVLTAGNLRVGVPVTVLGTNTHLQSRWSPRTTTIPVVGDEYIMYFGNRGSYAGEISTVIPVGTTIDQFVRYLEPVIIDPGNSFMIIPWAAGIGGAMSWEFEMVWGER